MTLHGFYYSITTVTGPFGISLTLLWASYLGISLQYLMCLFAWGFIWIDTTIKRSSGSPEADCWPSVFWSGKNKNGLHSHHISGKWPPVLSSCLFQRRWRQTQTVNSYVTWKLQNKFSSTVTELPASHLFFSISCILYSGQSPPTHSPTPTQVRPKLFTALWRAISHTLITQDR